jgi:hypothetical protein
MYSRSRVEARVRADTDAFLGGPFHHPVHDVGVRRVEAAGDARGTYNFEYGLVVANVVNAEALAEVGIEVDTVGRHGSGSCRG